MPDYVEASGGIRDVLYVVDEDAERKLAEGADVRVEATLDWAVGTGRLQMGDRDVWRPRLRREFDLSLEIIDAMKPSAALADRAFAEDPRIRSLADQLDSYMGVAPEDRVREFSEDDALPEHERMYRQLARLTGEAKFA